jgi:hypothetical protein
VDGLGFVEADVFELAAKHEGIGWCGGRHWGLLK